MAKYDLKQTTNSERTSPVHDECARDIYPNIVVMYIIYKILETLMLSILSMSLIIISPIQTTKLCVEGYQKVIKSFHSGINKNLTSIYSKWFILNTCKAFRNKENLQVQCTLLVIEAAT
jgi:hypothetical protein